MKGEKIMSEKKPNILLITTDQQRFDTINALGNEHIYTPHLNWLVDQGITFENCYTDSPVCMAARATIMTGKNGYSTGLVGNSNDIKPMEENKTLPEILTENGYQTRAQGKMHFSPMRAHYGFEQMELPMDYYRECKKNPEKGSPKEHGVGENEIEPVISTVDEEDSLTHWTVQRSIDFLETKDPTRPFFLWTSFTKPHPPYDPAYNYWDLYRNKDVPEPVYGEWSEKLEDMPQGYLASTYTLNNAYRFSEEQLKDCKRAYYACITQIDYTLGLLFARLREMNMLENTWIIFTTDHGDLMGDHHMAAKSVFLEGSAHIPLLIRPPFGSWESHELEGKRCKAPVDLADIMPTVLNIAGIEKPDGIDGKDLISQVDNEDEDRILYGNCGNKYFMVLEDNYKYMWTVLGGDELLFNLDEDPDEQHNLVDEKKDVLKDLRAKLKNHLKEHDSDLIEDDKLVSREAPDGPEDVNKWPGFHSKEVPTDVLH